MLIFYDTIEGKIVCVLDIDNELYLGIAIDTDDAKSHLVTFHSLHDSMIGPIEYDNLASVEYIKLHLEIPDESGIMTDELLVLIEHKLHKLHHMYDEIVGLCTSICSKKLAYQNSLLQFAQSVFYKFADCIGWNIQRQSVKRAYSVSNGVITLISEPNSSWYNTVVTEYESSNGKYFICDDAFSDYVIISITYVHLFIDAYGGVLKESPDTISRIFDICENMDIEAETLKYNVVKSARKINIFN